MYIVMYRSLFQWLCKDPYAAEMEEAYTELYREFLQLRLLCLKQAALLKKLTEKLRTQQGHSHFLVVVPKMIYFSCHAFSAGSYLCVTMSVKISEFIAYIQYQLI